MPDAWRHLVKWLDIGKSLHNAGACGLKDPKLPKGWRNGHRRQHRIMESGETRDGRLYNPDFQIRETKNGRGDFLPRDELVFFDRGGDVLGGGIRRRRIDDGYVVGRHSTGRWHQQFVVEGAS